MAKPATQNRHNARSEATGATQTSSTGSRRPAPPSDDTGGKNETTEAAPAMDPKIHSLIVVAPNPKRANSKAFGFYAKYPPPGVMSDVFSVRAAEVRGKDISWDTDRRHILVGTEAIEFNDIVKGDPFGKNRDAARDYLKSKGVEDKDLIKWGYMDKPAPEPASEPAKETATA